MQLDPNKTLEDNYRFWIASQKEDAQFFIQAWAHAAKTEQPTPKKSKDMLHQLQPELPSSYVVGVDESVNNLSRVIFEEAVRKLNDESGKNPWRSNDGKSKK